MADKYSWGALKATTGPPKKHRTKCDNRQGEAATTPLKMQSERRANKKSKTLQLKATMTDSDEEFIRNIKLTDVDFSVLDFFFY
ncbi:unnamed protein product [Aphanomyces euteiches]